MGSGVPGGHDPSPADGSGDSGHGARDLLAAGQQAPLRGPHRRLLQWLDRLDVAAIADKRPGQMSGGQSQRVAVARALVGAPRVIFADEPTGALDTLNGDLVMEQLVGAAREQGTSVVVVTHEARVAAYADRPDAPDQARGQLRGCAEAACGPDVS